MSEGRAYQERVCLFIDILGLKSWIDASDGSKAASSSTKPGSGPEVTVDFLHRVLSLVSRVRAEAMPGVSLSVTGSKQASQFSDSLVVSYLTRNPSIRLKHSWMRQKFNVVAEQIQTRRREISTAKDYPDLALLLDVTPFK